MKKHILLSLITLITLQIHAGEYAIPLNAQRSLINNIQAPLLSPHSYNQSLMHYKPQLELPNDIIDKIIAYCTHKDRAHLKKTCKQLSFLSSINRLSKFIIHDFNIGDDKDKSTLFKAIIQTSNPELITAIMNYAKKEATSDDVTDNAICINFDKNESIKKYIEENYLTLLLQEAIEQNNTTMMELLNSKMIDKSIMDEYKMKKRNTICLIISIPCMLITIAGTIAGGFMGILCSAEVPACGYNYTHY
jgi:hypothetical protein